jgi:hypothetical protein
VVIETCNGKVTLRNDDGDEQTGELSGRGVKFEDWGPADLSANGEVLTFNDFQLIRMVAHDV